MCVCVCVCICISFFASNLASRASFHFLFYKRPITGSLFCKDVYFFTKLTSWRLSSAESKPLYQRIELKKKVIEEWTSRPMQRLVSGQVPRESRRGRGRSWTPRLCQTPGPTYLLKVQTWYLLAVLDYREENSGCISSVPCEYISWEQQTRRGWQLIKLTGNNRAAMHIHHCTILCPSEICMLCIWSILVVMILYH